MGQLELNNFLLISKQRICLWFFIPFTCSHQHICSTVSYFNPHTPRESIRHGLLYIQLQNCGSMELTLCRISEVTGQLEVNITVLPQVTPDKGCLSTAYQWAR